MNEYAGAYSVMVDGNVRVIQGASKFSVIYGKLDARNGSLTLMWNIVPPSHHIIANYLYYKTIANCSINNNPDSKLVVKKDSEGCLFVGINSDKSTPSSQEKQEASRMTMEDHWRSLSGVNSTRQDASDDN
jgi:hypothetical protein